MSLFLEHGPRIIAEDLGVIPDFVRASLSRLDVPGLKVFRWEREWNTPGAPFRDPQGYPAQSVAVSGTHDTETIAEWWDEAPVEERTAVLAVPALSGVCGPDAGFDAPLRDALLAALFHARSDFVLLTFQDIFGWRDRINVPASVSATNWSWRLPWFVDQLDLQPDAQERASFLEALSTRSGRARDAINP
jgi:4-alpha-glucanotransferase